MGWGVYLSFLGARFWEAIVVIAIDRTAPIGWVRAEGPLVMF